MKKRPLSPEEEALWRRTTRDVRRLPNVGNTNPLGEKERPAFAVTPQRQGRKIMQSTSRRAYAPLPKPLTQGKPSVLGAGDPAQDKRVARRRMPIDARIDLHGMTQVAAEVALTAFLKNAREDGCRCVLVITGKGGVALRGVLHSRFSDWINSETVKPLIARAAPAHQKDGGAGAWYVFLKRKK